MFIKHIFKNFSLKSSLENEEHMANILKEFKQRFNKEYANEVESELKKNTLKTNLLKVFKHNAEANNGKESYTIGVNQFSDLSIEEIIKTVTGYWPSKESTNVAEEPKSTHRGSYYETSWWVDPYRAKYVTSIQNQVR